MKRGCSDCATAIGDAKLLRAELRRCLRVVRAATAVLEVGDALDRGDCNEAAWRFVMKNLYIATRRHLKGERRGKGKA